MQTANETPRQKQERAVADAEKNFEASTRGLADAQRVQTEASLRHSYDLSEASFTASTQADERVARQQKMVSAMEMRLDRERKALKEAIDAEMRAERAELARRSAPSIAMKASFERIGRRVLAFRDELAAALEEERSVFRRQRDDAARDRELADKLGLSDGLSDARLDDVRVLVGVALGRLKDDGAASLFFTPIMSATQWEGQREIGNPLLGDTDCYRAFDAATALLNEIEAAQ